MSLDAINEIQSRISEIQQSFSPASTSSSQQSTAATAAQNLQFADLLNAASSSDSSDGSSDGTTNGDLTGTGNADTSAIANALGLGSATGNGSTDSSNSLLDALTGALGGGTNSSVSALESALGASNSGNNGLSALVSALSGNTTSGTSGLGTLDPSTLASLEQILNSANGGAANGATATTATGVNSAANQKFVQNALAMAGDPYVYGATGSALDPHPKSFDCSGLTQWAAGRAGVTLPRTAQQQYLALKNQGDLIPVQQAINTPGALLFSFSSEPSPTNMYPSHAHVAISLGNGKTIEARGHAYGVGIFDAANRFNYAAVIPGLSA
jgi:cell wall-associated NlpC family hydrolase